jgi:hypothetical protein
LLSTTPNAAGIPDPDPILSAAHVATLTWNRDTDFEPLRRSHEALREQVRVLTRDNDELRERLHDLEVDLRARFVIERAHLEQRVHELEVAISKVLAWSEFALPKAEPAAIRDARATLAP